jgi:EAL domain-containing protein (putative c-di-GMP-specific phosphodiesterase class I)
MNENDKAKILFLIDKQADCDRFSQLLADLEFEVDWRWIKDLPSLTKLLTKEAYDLVLYWHQRKLVDETELVKFFDGMDDPPALVLVADQLSARDFIRASGCKAGDVLNAGLPAQFAFVVRRELTNIQTRRKLNAAINQVKDQQIVDESKLETRVDAGDLSKDAKLIDEALRHDQFELMFQPILAVNDDGYDNYEIFLRIRRGEDYGRPWEFLPAAEQYGLMPAIDRWVVQHAVKRFKAEEQVRRIRKTSSRHLRFFINLSGHSLVEQSIMSSIITEIVQARLEPGSFVIEVDKKTVLSRLQKVKSLNQNVKKLKLEFSLDHYEASDNKLNYLKHISLDYIKLNKAVIKPLASDPAVKEDVREIIAKARENNIKVIASQVENADVLPALYELGVDYIQGYLIADPGTRLDMPMLDQTIDSDQSHESYEMP